MQISLRKEGRSSLKLFACVVLHTMATINTPFTLLRFTLKRNEKMDLLFLSLKKLSRVHLVYTQQHLFHTLKSRMSVFVIVDGG